MRQLAIIIPTLNAAKHLPRCLDSIRAQKHEHKVSIIVVDGGSTDGTTDYLFKFNGWAKDFIPWIRIHNPLGYAEHGKLLGTQKALSLGYTYIMYMDADNELCEPEYIHNAINWLGTTGVQAFVECIPDYNHEMSSFNRYLTTCLQVADPLANFLVESPKGFSIQKYLTKYHYPTGANCCVFRAKDIKEAIEKHNILLGLEPFEDTIIALRILRQYNGLFIRLPGYYHYTAQNLWQFIQKRRRQTRHYLNTPRSPEDSWLPSRWKILLGVLYCLSVVGPCCETIYKTIKTGDTRWIWHPLACVGSVLGLVWGIFTPRTINETKLQPKV